MARAIMRPDKIYAARCTIAPDDEEERELIVFTRGKNLLSVEDVEILTGRKKKSLQCEQLRVMQIPFAENVLGHPLIPVAFFEGSKRQAREEVLALQRDLASVRASFSEFQHGRLKAT
jgi:hypothetical protein